MFDKKNNIKLLFSFLFLFGIFFSTSWAQENKQVQAFATEGELKKQATKLFDEEKFEAAFPLYTQLTSIYPKDPDYNYRLGVCMLYAVDDKEKPIAYLEFASSKPNVDREVLYYLARAYHLNYRFDDAIAQYKEYKKVATAAKAEKLQVERQIQMCNSGKQLMKNLTDLIVIDKKEMSKEDFYRAYDISEIGGKLLSKPDEKQFILPLDKRRKDKSIIYLNSGNNQVFFSSYGEDEKKGKDIYTVKKLDNGTWGEPQNLGAPVNTEYDEDFPFLHPNGKYLYFCSKGHNSMGGYDVFKSTYNASLNTWSTPVNMDFPVNTPDDDIMYVTDLKAKQAYFSSARSSTTGKTEVYHINVERKPIDVIIIKGKVLKNRDGQNLGVKITIKDLDKNNIVGMYTSKAINGEYELNMPNGGKFLISVESPSFETQSEVLVLPSQTVFKPLTQEISYELNSDKLVVNTIFDGANDDSNYLLALKYIKQKSKMEVMNSEALEKPTATSNDNNYTSSDEYKISNAPLPKITNAQLLKIALSDAQEADSTANEAQQRANIAMSFAYQKNSFAQNKTKEATQLYDDASRMTDNIKKQKTVDQANQANKEAEKLNQETVAAFNLTKKLNEVANSKQKEAELSKQYAKDLEAAIKDKNPKDAIAKLDEQLRKLERINKLNDETANFAGSLKSEIENKKKELDKAVKANETLKLDIADNKTIIETTKSDLDKARSSEMKKGLQSQIDGLQSDVKQAEKELSDNEYKVTELRKNYNGLINEQEIIEAVAQKAKTITNAEAASNVANIDKTKLEQEMYDVTKNVSQNKVVSTTNISDYKATAVENVKPVNTNVNAVVKQTENKTNNTIKNSNTETTSANTTNNGTETKVEAGHNDTVYSYVSANTGKTAEEQLTEINKKFNTELATASKISNEMNREEARQKILNTWKVEVADHIKRQKLEFENATDPNKKIVLNKNIADAEKVSTSIKTQTIESVTKLETIKKQEFGISTNTTQPTANTTVPSNTENKNSNSVVINSTETEVRADLPATASVTEINKHYSDKIIGTSNISNEVKREETKQALFNGWNKNLDLVVVKQKEDLKKATNVEEKNKITKKIKEAESATVNVKTQTATSVAKLEILKKQENISVAVTNENGTNITTQPTNNSTTQPTEENNLSSVVVKDSPLPTSASLQDINQHYTNQLTETSKITNELKREETKSQVLNYWNTAVDKHATIQKENLTKATNEQQKIFYNKRITEAEKTTSSIKTQTETSVAKVETLKKKENLTSTNSVVNSTSTTLQTSSNSTNATITTNNKDPNTTNVNTSQPINNTVSAPFPKLVEASASLPIINQKYNDALLETNKIANEFERENKKAEILKSWNEVLDSHIALQNQKLAIAKSEKEKNIITKNLIDSKIQVETVKTQSIAVFTKVKSLKSKNNYNTSVAQTNSVVSSKNEMNSKNNSTQPSPSNPNENVQPKTNSVNADVKKENNILPTEVFEQKKTAVYSANKPIPVNIELPKGVMFQVQIGAFTKPIPQNLFEGITPITGVTAAEGYTRYFAGMFVKFTSADNAKKQIKDAGYKDAFVVAYKDGKRIPIDEAMKMAGENPAMLASTQTAIDVIKNQSVNNTLASNTATNSVSTTQNQNSNKVSSEVNNTQTNNNEVLNNSITASKPETNNNSNTIVSSNKNNNELVNNPISNKGNNATVAPVTFTAPKNQKKENDVSAVEGLFYTVQIGVFSQKADKSKLNTGENLYYENTSNGYVRYNSGLYNNTADADKAKLGFIEKGLNDAFVTAYYNGKRIPLAEAKNYTAQASSQVATKNINSTYSQPIANNLTQVEANNNIQVSNQTNVQPKKSTSSQPVVNSATQPVVNNSLSSENQNSKETNAVTITQPNINSSTQPTATSVNKTASSNLQPANPNVNNETVVNTNKQTEITNTTQPLNSNSSVPVTNKETQPILHSTSQTVTNNSIPINSNNVIQSNNPTTTQTNENSIGQINNSNTTQPNATTNQPITNSTNQPILENSSTTENTTVSQPKSEVNAQTIAKNNMSVSNINATQSASTYQGVENEVELNLKDTAGLNYSRAVIEKIVAVTDTGLVFSIQIGAFKDDVPLDVANKFLKIKSKGINNFVDENGVTVYTVGNFKTIDEAGKLKSEIDNHNLADSAIVAFIDGKKISLDEARKLRDIH